MVDQFAFQDSSDKEEKPEPIAPNKQVKEKKKINFEELPKDTESVLDTKTKKEIFDRLTKEEPIAMPSDNTNQSSHLALILSPNLKDLELMIRGLEYVKRFNSITGKEEIILRKITDHPLNEYGINTIMSELRVYSSPEIKLGRKRVRDYYNSVQHVGHSIIRLIYKNLRNFGMDTQVKQRNAKRFCNAIIEIIDASYSRSVEGRENDASRPTEFSVQGNVDSVIDPTRFITPKQKENLKN